jgi:site-specific DNA-adenine methylase
MLPIDVDIIVEPFGGSFAVSKFFYTDTSKYKHHINDLDEEMYFIYNNHELLIERRDEFFRYVKITRRKTI